MRCRGQGYSVIVPLGDRNETVATRFTEIYETLYGHRPPDVPLEVVGLRARVVRPRSGIKLTPGQVDADSASESPHRGDRQVYFEAAGGYVETAFYDRYLLPKGKVFRGPAVIEERETSIVVGPDAEFFVDSAANVVIELEG
jgi:N-methylhydantoinase A